MSSPNLLEKLAAYVPTPIARAIYRQPRRPEAPTVRRFPAAVLLSDISGFTPLSEMLSRAGPTGAEELTQLINLYFTQMIQLVEAYFGQVVNFSGDAITCLFPAEEISMQQAARRAGECALAMQAKMSAFANLQTSQGHASLSMTVGIGAGEVLESSIGGVSDQWEYLVGGEPLIQVAQAKQHAQPGQIIASPPAWQEIQEFFRGDAGPEQQGFVNLHRVIMPLSKPAPISLDWGQLDPVQRLQAARALQCYIPATLAARLHKQADWLAELRRMTILFVGIGGLDYEAANVIERLQGFIQATQQLILDFEGLLNKVAVDDKGTILLILFGAPPFAHEDNATRAVACALNLQKIAQAQNLRMSIGITMGAVFAGPVGAPDRREYTVIGDEVNLAARLMQYGRAGAIVVSGRIRARLGSRFITESLGQISLKGKTAVLPAHLVKGEEGMQDRFMTRYLLHENPLVGRKAELELTRRVANRTRAGVSQILAIEGELGLGKSRLVSEMVREWVMAGGVGYGSKCISYGQQIPYQAWREILAALYGLTPSLSDQRQLARLAMGVAELEDPPQRAGYWELRLPLLAEVLDLDCPENEFTRNISGELRRNNTFELIEALLRLQVQRRPLLIVLEDVHWADELSLLLAIHLTKVMADTPLGLVLTHRPLTPEKDWPLLAEIKSLPLTHSTQLQPLSAEESLDLIGIVLGHRPLPPQAREILLSRGQGNPFFLQEISRAVLAVLESQAGRNSDLLASLDLPDTVQDVVLMHLDRLPEPEKLTLKVAAVIGVRFQRSILSAVHPTPQTTPLLITQLEGLEHEKLIQMEIPAPKWEYVFRNVITQEIVYEGLLLAQRRQLHAAVGAILEDTAPDEIESLAFHYSRSDNWERALHYLKIAGQKAQREYANQAAINYYSEILTCLAHRPAAGRAGAIISADYWDVLL
ncbi:MAG: adenylate/guanylate cyclase domain-containing protein, partial [Chloroflexota bacterium]